MNSVSSKYFSYLLFFFDSPSLPAFISEEFTKRLPKSVFATNPTRIRYCTQEIVVFREDIFTKMCRNCIRFPEAADLPMQVSGCTLNILNYFNFGLKFLISFFPSCLVCENDSIAELLSSRSPVSLSHLLEQK